MDSANLIPHLFRTEYGRITAVLCKRFGISEIEAAEDLASETFLAALNTWPYKGAPDEPVAWLYAVARNKARNYVNRKNVTERLRQDGSISPVESGEFIDLSEPCITDSQLQMLFAICHPTLPTESQIGLALRLLCGFGIDEIAAAFLTSKETINKRLFRAKEKLRKENIPIRFPAEAEVTRRIEPVLTTLYLMFNEGYHSESNATILREDICLEAMRLTYLLTKSPLTSLPEVKALLALMCFHASRFRARLAGGNDPVLYDDQDESLWDHQLITKGITLLRDSTGGSVVSKYHIEASIAYWHTRKDNTETKWSNILRLYDHLLAISHSPAAALNRIYALSKVKGKNEAIREAIILGLEENHYYHALLGELYREIDTSESLRFFRNAYAMAKTETEKRTLEIRIQSLL